MKKKLLNMRKHMWVLLVTAMLFGIVLLPVEKVFATETPENAEEQTETEEWTEWFDLGTTETSIPAMGLYGLADGVTLTGTAEKWIDRLELSGDATVIRDFYELLEEASDNDGYNDYLIEDQYYTGDDYYIEVLRISEAMCNADMKDKLSVYVRAAFDAFDRDHPEVFWLSGSTSFTISHLHNSNGDGECVVYFPIKYINGEDSFDIRDAAYTGNSTYEKEAKIKAGISKVEQYVDTYMTAVSGMTTVETVKYFNSQLTKTNQYSTAEELSTIHHECRECISALEGRTGVDGPVCEAYARAFKVLCDEAGIPCVLVDGDAVTKSGGSGPHMWNYVKVEDNWYGVDVTWNDPSGSEITGAESGYEREDYLLVGSSTVPNSHNLPFIESHPVENCVSTIGIGFVNGPELAVTAYSSTMPISLKILKGDSEIVITNEDGTTTGCTTSGNAGNGTWCYENGVLTLNGVTELGNISWYGGNLEIELSGINTGCGKISFNDILEGVLTIQGPGVLEAEEISCLMEDTLYVWVIDSTILLDELTATNTVSMSDSILRNGKYIIVGGTVTLVSEVVIPSDATIFFTNGASIVNLDMLTVEDGATIKVGDTVHNHSMSSVYSVLEENEKHQKTEVCEGCPIQYKVVTKEDCTFEEVDGTTQCIYCGAKKIQSDSDYVGDGEIGYTLSVSEFEDFDSDVVITVKYRIVPAEMWSSFGMYRDLPYEGDGYHDNFLKEADFVYIETMINEYDMIEAPADDSEVVVILKKEVAEALTVDEILFPVWGGVVIEEVIVSELSDVDTEIELDTEYPEADEGGSVVSAVIPALNLLQFDGPVAVTLDYMTTGTEEYPSFAANTVDWKDLSPIGNVTINAEEGTITFVLEEEDVETAIADGGVMFWLNGVWFTKATLTVATADDYYAGDWNVAYTFTADELAELEGDIIISGEYTILSEANVYDWYGVQFVGASESDWKILNANDFVGSGHINEDDWMGLDANESEFSITLKVGTLKKLKEAGSDLVINTYGVIVQTATLQEVDPDYAGEGEIGYTLPVSSFEGIEGDVVLTVKYRVVPTETWPNFGLYRDIQGVEDYRQNFLKEADFAYLETSINQWDMIDAMTDDSEIVIVLKKEVVEALTVDEILFPVWGGVVIEEVIVSEAQLVGKTGSVIVDDTTNPNGLVYISIPDGVPEDGQVHLVTYEIYDETGTAVGTLEYRACSEDDKASAWITAHGVERNISFIYDLNYDSVWDLSEPKMTYGEWDFGESDYKIYREYSYRVIGNKVISEKKISAVSELSWDDTKTPGWIVWEAVEGAAGYKVSVVRKEDEYPIAGGYMPAGNGQQTLEMNVADRIIESGTYVVRIVTCGGKDSLDSDWTELPAQYVYTRPDVEVGVTNKVWWTAAEGAEVPTVANWTPVVGAKGYEVMLSAYDAANPEEFISGVGYDVYNTDEGLSNQWNFAWNINNMNAEAAQAGKTYIYTVSVRALSGNIELLANARDEDTFKSSGEYKTKEAIEAELKTRLEETISGGSDISTVFDSMSKEDKDDFGDAMKHNQELQELLKEAESKRGVKVNQPEVDKELGIDPGAVKAVGAGMNAQSGTVGLVLKPAENEIEVDNNLYHHVTQMDISLKHEDGNTSTTISELDVPMLITVPAPANIDPERVVVLHEHDGVTDVIYPLYDAENKKISFAVTSFSTFAFAGINLFNESGENETIVPVEPETLAKIKSASLDLISSITVYFWALKNELNADENSYAVVEFNDKRYTIPKKDWKTDGSYASKNDSYKIPFEGVAAKEMGDSISITIYNSSGVAITETGVTTVGRVAKNTYNQYKDNKALRDLCVEMLKYGAAAQTFFTYNSSDLVTNYFKQFDGVAKSIECMSEENSLSNTAILVESNKKEEGVTISDGLPKVKSASLDLVSSITVYFWLLKSEVDVDEDSYAVVEFNDKRYTIPKKDWKTDGSYASKNDSYKIPFEGVAAKEMGDTISITVYNSAGVTITATGVTTVGRVAKNTYNQYKDDEALRNLCVAMLKYGAAAQTFFTHNSNDLVTKYFDEFTNVSGNISKELGIIIE